MKTKKKRNNETLSFYLFILPFLIGFSLFTVFPMIMSLLFSFNKISILDYAQGFWNFNHFQNYADILSDSKFFIAMKNTFVFAILRVSLTMLIALGFAILLNKKIPGRKIFRTLIYIPAILPVVGSAVLWKQLFDGRSSIFSYVLSFVGIHVDPVLWLGEYGLYSAIFMSIIMNIGPAMIIILAGLQGIPQDLVEAAQIDGAPAYKIFFRITLPFISSVLFFLSITNMISCLQTYAEIDLLIGQLSESSMTMSMLVMYNYKDPRIGLGYSSAMAWLIFLIVLVFTSVYFACSKNKMFYAGD